MLRTLLLLCALAAQILGQAIPAAWHELPLAEGGSLAYKLGLPDGFDPAQTYPVLLALPPGSQGRDMVEASWARYWGEQASRRGWIVVSPAAPEGGSFVSGAERLLPELIDHVRASYRVEHGRLHLAGVSNGGRGAFRLATQLPHEFLSLTVLPGYPSEPEDMGRLAALADLPVSMYVGADDALWVTRMESTAAILREIGVAVTTTTLPGEGHTPPSLDGDVIIDRLEELRDEVAGTGTATAPPVADGPRATLTTTVLVVRHADRRGADDALSEAGHARAEALARLLEPTALDAIYTTQFLRTQQTVAPTARAHGLEPHLLPADQDLAAHLLRAHAGQAILAAGHSNTVPATLRGLGLTWPGDLSEDRYGDLFVVTVTDGEARLVQLAF